MMKLVGKNNIAIVIPAYKATFFREALSSIENQTCKKFHVYIGDDGSPDDLYDIVKEFDDKIPITYRRFHHNIGRKDLIAHWERCIDMVQHEQWIWFFSDDDKIDPTCVEKFYSNIEQFPEIDIFHLDVKQINSKGDNLENKKFPNFPHMYSTQDYCRDRLTCRQQSYAVEFIFRKSKFMEVGRFQKFDLAWGSDVATCIKLSWPRGILTIEDAYVYWRESSLNISPNCSPEMVNRKLTAVVDFFEWLVPFSRCQNFNVRVNPLWIYFRRFINFRCKQNITKTLGDIVRLLRLNSNLWEQ